MILPSRMIKLKPQHRNTDVNAIRSLATKLSEVSYKMRIFSRSSPITFYQKRRARFFGTFILQIAIFIVEGRGRRIYLFVLYPVGLQWFLVCFTEPFNTFECLFV